ncbi:MAG: outer membrane protein [Pyrinomonadaceae bacterium]
MRNSTKKFTSTVLSFVFLAIAVVATHAQSTSTSDDWTGVYVGGHAGITVGRTGVNTSTIFSPTGYFFTTSVPAVNAAGAQTIESNGFNGGGQAGYNKQFGRFVIGAEADFGAHGINKEIVSGDEYPCCSTEFEIAQSVKTRWMFTARPRVGVTAGPALLYATGGLAMTDVEYNAVFTDNDSDALETASFKKTRTGYAAGGGVEVKMSDRWSAKVEYLFADFGRVSGTSNNLTTTDFGGKEVVGGSGTITWPENTFTHSARVKSHNIRFGMNYRF